MKITRMRTENRENPLGIDRAAPVFGWNIIEAPDNWRQESYRITVRRGESLVWDSGVVPSAEMVYIPYAGAALTADTAYRWTLTVCGGGESAQGTAAFETGLLTPAGWQGRWIGETEDGVFHLYRKAFALEKPVARARLYVCGLGHFTGSLNGQPLSDHLLEPGWSDYRKTCCYATYDVTETLCCGENALGFMLGDGMFNLPSGRYVYYERSYGKMKLLVQLNITFADGTAAALTTDGSWQMAPGPITFCGIYGGLDYDARLAHPGWTLPGYQLTADWQPAVLATPAVGRLTAATTPPLRVMQRYTPVSARQTRPGVWLYDLGKNFSGWARVRVALNGAPAGSVITLTPGELVDANGTPDQRVTGRGYHWQYTLCGDERQEFAPDFTYTGFRYVQLEGAAPAGQAALGLPVVEALTGEFIYPDAPQDGSFTCSNELFNKIHAIICQAILSNTKSYLTDCPHRERLPWMEQTHLIAAGVMYNYDTEALYEKIERDILDAQHEDGLVPDICPEYVVFGYHRGFVDTPEWGSAAILDPWYAYRRWGNRRLLAESYGGMKKYLDYLTGKTHHDTLHHGLGDWLDIGPNRPYAQNTPVPVTATAIYYYDIRVLQKAAALLGKTEDEKELAKLAARVYEEYNAQFFDDQTDRYATGSQAAQAISLVVGLVPPEHHDGVVKKLREDILHRGYAITAGDVGHPFLIRAAIREGLSDLINAMTEKTDTPGYGYQVQNGATTLTEEWDGPDPANPHGSQNHFMLGGIEEWFYSALGGIRLLHSELPFGQIEIKPYLPAGMDHCAVSLRHPYGMVRVSWQKSGAAADYTIELPANLTAVLQLAGMEETTIGAGCHRFTVPLQGE